MVLVVGCCVGCFAWVLHLMVLGCWLLVCLYWWVCRIGLLLSLLARWLCCAGCLLLCLLLVVLILLIVCECGGWVCCIAVGLRCILVGEFSVGYGLGLLGGLCLRGWFGLVSCLQCVAWVICV